MKKLRKIMLAATVCLSMGLTLFPMTVFAEGPPDEGGAELQIENTQQEEQKIEVESIYLEPTLSEQQEEEQLVTEEAQQEKEETPKQAETQQEEEIQQAEAQQEEIQQAEAQQEEETKQAETQQEEEIQQAEAQQEGKQQAEAQQEEKQQTEALQEGQPEEVKANTAEGTKDELTEAKGRENTVMLLNSGNEMNIDSSFQVQEEETEILAPGFGRASNTSQYGNSYDHVDVKVDAKYNVKVDGVSYSLDGFLQSNSIVVTVGNNIYAYANYKVKERAEAGKYEYDISVKNLSPSTISWVNGGYTMSNVNVRARILFATVPEALQTILSTVVIDNTTYYYADFDMPYTGVQECTGGKGMRSEGKTGTPTGLDLYITKDAADIIITKGRLGIEKLIVDEKGNAIEDDNTAFTFEIKGNTVEYENVIEVLGGSKTILENLPAGSYTITEKQVEGYAIYSIDGNETDNYSYNYTVVVKEDGDIPVATFTNTKLSDKSAITLQKKAEGLGEDASYPDPTIRIYAIDEEGNKSEKPVWENTVSANGDTIYLNVYLDTGKYMIEESGESVREYDCDSMFYLNGVILSGNEFVIDEGGQNLAIDVINNYSKTIIPSEPDPDPEPEPKPEVVPDPEPEPEPEIVPDPEPKKVPETPVVPKKETKEEAAVAEKETQPTAVVQTAVVPTPIVGKVAPQTSTAPKTGDAEIMQIWLVMLVLAGTGLAAASYWKKMNNR